MTGFLETELSILLNKEGALMCISQFDKYVLWSLYNVMLECLFVKDGKVMKFE